MNVDKYYSEDYLLIKYLKQNWEVKLRKVKHKWYWLAVKYNKRCSLELCVFMNPFLSATFTVNSNDTKICR
jgi:hypothetical protein